MLGAQNVNVRSQNETDGFRAEVSHTLRTGRRWVSGLHCEWRWNMGFSPHSWIQATMMRCKKKSWSGSKGRRQTSMTRGNRSWFQDLTLRLLMSYIYGAPSKARNANVVYIWTYAETVSFYLLHTVSILNQCREVSCVTFVCKHFAS